MSIARQRLATTFIDRSGWKDTTRSLLAGDASNRRYDRLKHPQLGSAVLMDAPPEKGEDTRPFTKIAHHLTELGLSAPQIYASDPDNGFLLIEDLGDDLFARVLKDDISIEKTLYQTATEALIVAQQAAAPISLSSYDIAEMAQTSLLATDWYLKFAELKGSDIRDIFHGKITALLNMHLTGEQVLAQRDYHAENLLWLPERNGVAKVGLLDFQDAMLGPPAYDLASLLKDARRDVSIDVQRHCLDYFVKQTGTDPDQFSAAYAMCSAQRNLRVIGVFARLSIRDGKRHYPDMLPRVWRNLVDDLRHPVLQEFGSWIQEQFPEPTPEIIAHLKTSNV